MTNTELLHIGTIIQNARLFNPQYINTMSSENILSAVRELFRLFEHRHVKYVLVGGIAMLQYIPGRNTEDIDLIVAVKALKKIPEIVVQDRDVYFARGSYQNVQIDFLLTENPIFNYVQRNQTIKQQFVEQEITCATVEGLLLLKLYALPSLYRQGNFARVGLYENDIATLLYYYNSNTAPLLARLEKHMSVTDVQAIQETLRDIQKRITRFQRDEPEDAQ